MALSKDELKKTETALKAAFDAFDTFDESKKTRAADGLISKDEMLDILTHTISAEKTSIEKEAAEKTSIEKVEKSVITPEFAEKKWAAWLKAFDANNDGKLEVAEIVAALAHKVEVDRLYDVLGAKSTTYDGRDFPWYNPEMHGADWKEVVKKLLDSLKAVGGGRFLEAILTDVELCRDLFNRGRAFHTPFGALLDGFDSLLAGPGEYTETVIVETWDYVKANTKKKQPAKTTKTQTKCPILGFDDEKVQVVAEVLKLMMDCVRKKMWLIYDDANKQCFVHKQLSDDRLQSPTDRSLLACAASTLNYDLMKTVHDAIAYTGFGNMFESSRPGAGSDMAKGAIWAASVSVNSHSMKIPGRTGTMLRGVAKTLPDDPTMISGPKYPGDVKDFLIFDDTAAAKTVFGEDLSEACLVITSRTEKVDDEKKCNLVAFAFDDLDRVKWCPKDMFDMDRKLEWLAKWRPKEGAWDVDSDPWKSKMPTNSTPWEALPKISNVSGTGIEARRFRRSRAVP